MKAITVDKSPLLLEEQTKSKLVCGLQWDPLVDKSIWNKLLGTLGKNVTSYDLDISCYCYDEHKSLMDFVTGKEGELVDRSENIVHSGDCVHGEGEGDDEAITFDLSALPDYIQNIVILVEVGSAHSFSEVANPYVRIADELTDQDILELSFNSDYSACVFATLSRKTNEQWVLYRNNYLLDHEQIESWPDFLSQFIPD